jgi:hypothetical protein
MRIRESGWMGWPILAALVGALLAAFTLRHGIVPGSDGVSYWSASVNASRGHPFTSGLIPAFSDLSYRDLAATGRASFVDFPSGYPLVVGGIGALIGVINAQWLLMVLASAAICGLIVLGPHRPATFAGLGTRYAMAWVAVGLPIAVQVRQGALPEPLFIAGLLLFALALMQLRDGRRGPMSAAVIGGVLGILRFVGLPLVVILFVQAWRSGVRRWSLARSLTICGAPGLLHAFWAARITGRQPQWMHRSAVDFKFAAFSITGWFTSFKTGVGDVLSGPWQVPVLFYLIAAIALLGIAAGFALWLRDDRDPAALMLALAAALLGAVIITMFFYDALTKFEPRMLYPPAVLLFAGFAWSTTLQQRLPRWAFAIGCIWIVLAALPTKWEAPRFQATALRAQAARDTGAKMLVSNSADLVHYETGIPAAYFPSPVQVHSGRAQDRDALMIGFPCVLLRAEGAVLIDSTGYLPPDPWIIDYLDRFVAQGTMRLTSSGDYYTFLPTPAACTG